MSTRRAVAGTVIDPSVANVINDPIVGGVLVNAVTATGKWVATAARAPRGRKAEDLSIARWFETYKLTGAPPIANAIPGLAALSPADAERLADALRGPDIQASLQELLSVRLTDAPENDAARARETFCLTLTLHLPLSASLASPLADFYDDQICALVSRLGTSDPAMLAQIRSEALSARMIAVLNAIERHTAALSSGPRDADTFLSNYRRQVIEQHGKLQPPDFDRRRRVTLADIYVPATIYEDPSSERIMASPQPPPSLTVWELAARTDRTILLGDPGGGKTTASNVLMHHFASDVSRRIPFLVTLRDFAAGDRPERSVVGWIEHQLETFYQCPASPGLVDILLLTGRAIVFFDGLDELLDTSRRSDVATRVERFCTEYPLAPVLVTSRSVGYDQARLDDSQFTCYRLGGFRDEDVTAYVRKWFALDSDACSDEADAFMSESESVTDLRSNPLLLSLMCILYRGEGSLPRNRAEIYEQCANLLFRKWDARRRIHQDLRAGHLIEPTLRHLAWWLFTREDTQSAVTERDLVNAATEFLHGRGFESPDEARDAAREFIEFCRGRMWVFSDTGTTATGEKLYSFTHRTFLEYFAASQLAFDSDTPEKLARTLLPHIAKGEWEVVGELAVQIKDNTSTEGAKRIYETILNDRRRRAPAGRSNILQFLARSLRSVEPSPQVTRRLTRATVHFIFSAEPAIYELGLPFKEISGFPIPEIIEEEIPRAIVDLIHSPDPQDEENGLLLAMSIQAFFVNTRLTKKMDTIIYGHSEEITRTAPRNNLVLAFAVYCEIITVDKALAMKNGVQSLLKMADVAALGMGLIAPLLHRFWLVAHGPLEEPNTASAVSDLTAFGRHLIKSWKLPLVSGFTSPWELFNWNSKGSPWLIPLDPTTYLGGAVTLCISAEKSEELPSRTLSLEPSNLGQFSDLYSYIESRKSGQPAPQSLPDLPVPEEFKQVFRDWAAGKVNFVGDSPDASA